MEKQVQVQVVVAQLWVSSVCGCTVLWYVSVAAFEPCFALRWFDALLCVCSLFHLLCRRSCARRTLECCAREKAAPIAQYSRKPNRRQFQSQANSLLLHFRLLDSTLESTLAVRTGFGCVLLAERWLCCALFCALCCAPQRSSTRCVLCVRHEAPLRRMQRSLAAVALDLRVSSISALKLRRLAVTRAARVSRSRLSWPTHSTNAI